MPPPALEDFNLCDAFYAHSVQRLRELGVDSDLVDTFLTLIRERFDQFMSQGLALIDARDHSLKLALIRTLQPSLGDGLASVYRGTDDQRTALHSAGYNFLLKLRAEQIKQLLSFINGHP